MKTSIKQIRDIIRTARWLRNDLVGGTSEEFRKQQVGPMLAKKVLELRALQIPSRFAEDIERRDEEISYCLRVIGRWEAAQVTTAVRMSPVFVIHTPGHA